MKFKKDDEGKLVLDDSGDPIAIDNEGNTIPLDKVVSLGKHQRIEDERNELKAKVDELTKQIGDLQKVAGDAEATKTKLEELAKTAEEAQADFEARMAARDREYALDIALRDAGVPKDLITGAKAYIGDEVRYEGGRLTGFDAESFKKERPFLFPKQETFGTGAPPSGAPANEEAERISQMREAAGLPPKKE